MRQQAEPARLPIQVHFSWHTYQMPSWPGPQTAWFRGVQTFLAAAAGREDLESARGQAGEKLAVQRVGV